MLALLPSLRALSPRTLVLQVTPRAARHPFLCNKIQPLDADPHHSRVQHISLLLLTCPALRSLPYKRRDFGLHCVVVLKVLPMLSS